MLNIISAITNVKCIPFDSKPLALTAHTGIVDIVHINVRLFHDVYNQQ